MSVFTEGPYERLTCGEIEQNEMIAYSTVKPDTSLSKYWLRWTQERCQTKNQKQPNTGVLITQERYYKKQTSA